MVYMVYLTQRLFQSSVLYRCKAVLHRNLHSCRGDPFHFQWACGLEPKHASQNANRSDCVPFLPIRAYYCSLTASLERGLTTTRGRSMDLASWWALPPSRGTSTTRDMHTPCHLPNTRNPINNSAWILHSIPSGAASGSQPPCGPGTDATAFSQSRPPQCEVLGPARHVLGSMP
jgi:hypothetical protein